MADVVVVVVAVGLALLISRGDALQTLNPATRVASHHRGTQLEIRFKHQRSDGLVWTDGGEHARLGGELLAVALI